MAIRIVKALIGTVALGALISVGTELAVARGGGFGGGHGFSGGHGFGGAHIGGFRGFSGARMGSFRSGGSHIHGLSAHSFSTHGRSFAHSRNFAHRSNLVHNSNLAHSGNLAHTNSIAHNSVSQLRNAHWNQWGNPYWKTGWNGGWNGGCCGWWHGSVFWPYFFGDLLAFVVWPPYGYYPFWFDPFWGYGDILVWDAIFWPGPYYAYAYGPPYYDIYGDYGYYGYPRRRYARAHYVDREATGSVPNNAELAQSCGGLAPGVTDLPIDRIQTTLHLTDDQLKALDALKAASSQASDVLKASCANEVPLTPVGRLDAMQKRIDGMIQALGIVRTPLDSVYNSLNEEQRRQFAALGPASNARTTRPASGNSLAALCSRREENFAQPPVERIAQVIRPTQAQHDALEKLKSASTEAANQLQASCPAELPQAPMDRFDAVAKRLDAMAAAVKTVRPALDSFYASLTDEQKAQFNVLAPPKTSSSRGG